MKNIFKYCVERLKERSTGLGLASLATAAGLLLSPEQKEAVVAAGMALAGLAATLMKDVK